MLRLRGKDENGRIYEFELLDILEIDSTFGVSIFEGEIVYIDPSTIRPADDPRKQMLEEIRQQINGLPGTDYSCAGDTVYIHQEVNRKRVSEIIDEMEAKL